MVAPWSPETQFGANWPGRRCLARTRRGSECQKPAIKGRARCQLHGGRSTGAPRGEAHGRYVNGQHTIEVVAERRAKADAGRRAMKRVKLASEMARVAGLFEGQTPRSSPVVVEKFYKLKAQYDALLEPSIDNSDC
jgi:hypothetical protein